MTDSEELRLLRQELYDLQDRAGYNNRELDEATREARMADLREQIELVKVRLGGPSAGTNAAALAAEAKNAVLSKELEESKAENAALSKELEAVRGGGPRVIEPLVWLGQKSEWAQEILGWRKRNVVRAESDTEALRKAAAHFVDSRGKPFNERSVLQTLQRKR